MQNASIGWVELQRSPVRFHSLIKKPDLKIGIAQVEMIPILTRINFNGALIVRDRLPAPPNWHSRHARLNNVSTCPGSTSRAERKQRIAASCSPIVCLANPKLFNAEAKSERMANAASYAWIAAR
jgi:hypothetical protein